MDNTGQLINYIVQELKRGVPEASIRSALLQNGWPTEPVDRAFTMLRQNEPAVSSAAPAAELPAVNGTRPTVQPVQIRQKTPSAGGRRLISWPVVAGVAVLLATAAFGVFLLVSNMRQPAADNDTQRKTTLNALADKLTAHYTTKDTYPTLAGLNSPGFAATEDGFDVAEYSDPAWSAENTACKDKSGGTILTGSRASGCYAYRATALNGDDCDAGTKKCTRAVLTATLDSGEPYIIVLDQNQKEER